MKTALGLLLVLVLTACASTSFQQYEGRDGPKIVEGQGGTKEVIDGIEVWGTGDPPRRYQVLGVTSVEDFDNVFGNSRIRSAIAAQTKAAAGDAAIAIDASGGGQFIGTGVSSKGTVGTTVGFGKKTVRFQIVKYLDRQK
jgi:hypothetical protein